MTSDADQVFNQSVPYDGFDEGRAMAFALSEAIWVRYGMTVAEYVVRSLNCDKQISGKVLKVDKIFPRDVVGDEAGECDIPLTHGYRIELSVIPAT